MTETPEILAVCVHDAGCTHAAEAMPRLPGRGHARVLAARPTSRKHGRALAVAAMREIGVNHGRGPGLGASGT